MDGDCRGRITPEKALEILRANGLDVTLEQATIILKYLYKLANMAVEHYLNHDQDR